MTTSDEYEVQYGNKNTVRAERMIAELVTTSELTQEKSEIQPEMTLPRVLEIPMTETRNAASSTLILSCKVQ